MKTANTDTIDTIFPNSFGTEIALMHDKQNHCWYFMAGQNLRQSTSYSTRKEALAAYPNWIVWLPKDA